MANSHDSRCMRRIARHRLAPFAHLLLSCASLIACREASTLQVDDQQLPRDGASYFPATTWRTGDPNAVGMPLDGTSPSGGRDDTIWMASGNLNNWLFVVPKHDLVVVVTGGDNRSFGMPVDFLYREILPSVVSP
jgi:hypothetical protein